MHDKDFRRFALEGARVTLARIYATFPELAPAGMVREALARPEPRQPARNARRPHWTQTPEGRKRMSRISRRAWKDGTR